MFEPPWPSHGRYSKPYKKHHHKKGAEMKRQVATNVRQCANWSPKWVPKCIPNSLQINPWGPHPPNGAPKWSFLGSRCVVCVPRVPHWSPNRQQMYQKSYPEADKQKQTRRPTDQEKSNRCLPIGTVAGCEAVGYSILYTLYSILYILYSILYTLYSTLYIVGYVAIWL